MSSLREHHFMYEMRRVSHTFQNEEIHSRHMKEKLQKMQPEELKKKAPISLEDEPLSITNIVVRIWNVTDAMLTIK